MTPPRARRVPTARALALAGLAAPVALSLALILPDWFVLALVPGAALLVLLMVDAIAGLRARAIDLDIVAPKELEIGATASVSVTVTRLQGANPVACVGLLEVSGPLAPPLRAAGSIDVAGAAPAADGRLNFPLAANRRGPAALETLVLRWSEPLGLVHTLATIPLDRQLVVVPNLAAVRQLALSRMTVSDLLGGAAVQRPTESGSFAALREYMPGMDIRTIDWKRSARHRKPLAREYDLESDQDIILAFDTGHLMGEPLDGVPRLDHAIAAGLLVGFLSLRAGDRVGLFGFDADAHTFSPPTSGRKRFADLRRRASSLRYAPSETNFTLGLTTLMARLRRRAFIIILSEFIDSITAELMIDSLKRVSGRHLVLFVSLGEPDAGNAEGGRAAALRRRRPGRHCRPVPDRTASGIRPAGASGRPLPGGAARAYRGSADQYLSRHQAAGVDLMEGELKSVRFRREREQSWRKLELLLTEVERRGAHRLSIDEAIELPVLYRSCLSSLSVARAISADRSMLTYLEALALRSYLIVHSRRFRFFAALGQFYGVTLPRAIRAEGWLIGLAILVMGATILAGYQLVRADLAYFNAIVDPGLAGSRTPAASPETLRHTLYDQPPALESLARFAAYLFSHNAMVAVLTFAVGFALMVPTLLLVAINGLMIGAMVALFAERGLGLDMLAWLSIHGPPNCWPSFWRPPADW